MDRADRAVQLFRSGHACSQSVLLAWAPDLGLDEGLAARLAAPFAGGMRIGGTCGAVTGGLLVLGLATCKDDCVTREGRVASSGPALEFARRFRERFGSLDCPGIIGCDLRDPAAAARAHQEGWFETRCEPAVRGAAELLGELLPTR